MIGGTAAAQRPIERAGAFESLGLLVRSVRPRQLPKNGAVFFGLIFARQYDDPAQVLRAAAAAVLFCLLSGAVYIVNDLLDLEKDRLHPRKRQRPLASGRLSPGLAAATAALLAAVAIGGSFLLSMSFGLVACGYVLLQVLYVTLLKHAVILDVLALSMGFVLRAVAGAVAVSVPISPWLYMCALLLALFLALGKRRQELVSLTAEDAVGHRPALEQYTLPLLDHLIQVVTTCLVLAYMLYTFSAENLPRNHAMMVTVPFVLYGLFRYLYLVHVRGEGGAPEDIFWRDRGIALCVLLWAVACIVILYVFPPA